MRDTSCAPVYILGLLGRKWTYRVLRHLHKPLRFSQVAAHIPTVTHHVLTEDLRLLEREGLIVHDEDTYQLTPAGESLLKALENLFAWANEHKGFDACPADQSCANCARYREETLKRV